MSGSGGYWPALGLGDLVAVGLSLVAAATGASADTVGKGAVELEAGLVVDGRVRVKGAGRPSVEQIDPQVWAALDALVDPVTRGGSDVAA